MKAEQEMLLPSMLTDKSLGPNRYNGDETRFSRVVMTRGLASSNEPSIPDHPKSLPIKLSA